jgi:hypothetical protein
MRRGRVNDAPPTDLVARMTTTITAILIGNDTAHAGDIVCRGRSPVFGLCRALLAAGADPESRLECYRAATLALTVKSIGRGAKLTIKESDRGGFQVAHWEPFPSHPVGSPIRWNGSEDQHHHIHSQTRL